MTGPFRVGAADKSGWSRGTMKTVFHGAVQATMVGVFARPTIDRRTTRTCRSPHRSMERGVPSEPAKDLGIALAGIAPLNNLTSTAITACDARDCSSDFRRNPDQSLQSRSRELSRSARLHCAFRRTLIASVERIGGGEPSIGIRESGRSNVSSDSISARSLAGKTDIKISRAARSS
jgi:hypothetical protein